MHSETYSAICLSFMLMERGLLSTDKAEPLVIVFLWPASELSSTDVVQKYLRVADPEVGMTDCGKTVVTLGCHLNKPLLAPKKGLPVPWPIFFKFSPFS